MKKIIIFLFLIILFVCSFVFPYKANASCNVGMIEQDYNSVGLGGSALENSAVQNCMDEQEQDFQNNLNQLQNQYQQQTQEELQRMQQPQIVVPQQTQQEQQAVTAEVYSQHCQGLYGANVVWDGTFNSNNGLNCACEKGFTWNKAKTACLANNQACVDFFGSNSVWSGNYGSNGGTVCSCIQGFIWNSDNTECIAQVTQSQPQVVIPPTSGVTVNQPIHIGNSTGGGGNNLNTIIPAPENNVPKIKK